MRNPICLLRAIYRSIRTSASVSGHDFEVDSEPTPGNVTVLRCKTCGAYSIGWDWGKC